MRSCEFMRVATPHAGTTLLHSIPTSSRIVTNMWADGCVDGDDDGSMSEEMDDDDGQMDFTQESIDVGVAGVLAPMLPTPSVSQEFLFTRFKNMLGMFNTPSSRMELFNTLLKCEEKQRKRRIDSQNGRLVQPEDTKFASINLAYDKDKESKCHPNYGNIRKKRRKKRGNKK